MSVEVPAVERTMRALAEQSNLAFSYRDPTTGDRHILSPDALSSESGYLPAIVSAGEAVWREATGKGLNLDIARDPDAMLGYRLRGLRHARLDGGAGSGLGHASGPCQRSRRGC